MLKKIFILITILVGAAGVSGAFWVKENYESGKLQEKIIQTALPEVTKSATSTNYLSRALGMEEPRTYLALFLNNTELRPGGGFIGSYAVVRMDRSRPEILKVEGTEIIDNYAPGVGNEPPEPLAKYLGIKKMQFRDSNWSPDFSTSAKLAIELYKKENGLEADSIDGVIGITPTLFEEILKITGPVVVEGIEFKSDNFTEKLEYEVEYGFKERGVSFDDRKGLLSSLSSTMLPKLLKASLTNWSDFMMLGPEMIKQKQIMLYATDPEEQNYLVTMGWAGAMKKSASDYLLWVDANLGALKTDVAIKRTLFYSISSTTEGYLAKAKMEYKHEGKFNWRITRYRDYARVFVPAGSKLVKVEGAKESGAEGEENGYQWFGAFISIEPGKKGELTFTYLLPKNISDKIAAGDYDLMVQKQLGSNHTKLTLDLKFDKNLKSADPAESYDGFYDAVYKYTSELKEDKEFSIKLSQ